MFRPDSDIHFVSEKEVTWRRCFAHAFEKPLYYRIDTTKFEGYSRAKELMADGYGLIIVFNHFSWRDGLVIVDWMMSDEDIRQREVVMPMAYHQYDMFKLIINPLSKLSNLHIMPIVISDTLQKKRYRHLPLGYGMLAYMQEAKEVMESHGVIGVNPQQGRRASLGEPTVALSLLMYNALQENIGNRYALLFTGLDIEGASDYEKLRGLNLGQEYVLTTGNCFTRDEIFDATGVNLLKDKKTIKETIRNVDPWALRQFSGVVSPVYFGNNGDTST
jgi:hypothetical protein